MKQNLFDIVGESFFKPLNSQFRVIYMDCLRIIYNAYRTELSFGIGRDIMVNKLADYFEELDVSEIVLEDDSEVLRDAHAQASKFLRKLREFGWIEQEIGNDQIPRIIMRDYAVTMMKTLLAIESRKEMEYQSEISAIYSLLTNEELLGRPYPQVIKPVYDHTLALFTGLKQLNTSIRKYIEEITADKSPEEIMEEFFRYHDQIGSKAYHRIKTNENVSRFRPTILNRLHAFQRDEQMIEKITAGYQNVEEETDRNYAEEQVRDQINEIISHFNSYDELIHEIDLKHTRYIRNAVERAKFLLLTANNVDGKISAILQTMAEEFNRDETANLADDAPEDLCQAFNIFPHGYLSNESLKPIIINRKITDVNEVFQAVALSEEEREQRRQAIYEKNRNRFSRKNIQNYVQELLKGKEMVMASSLPLNSRRDAIRLIFICLYGRNPRSNYLVVQKEEEIVSQGFRFRDFEIKRRAK